jgi:hypothetical protein
MNVGSCSGAPSSRQQAYTLTEAIAGSVISAIMLVGLYLGFSQGFAFVQLSRENLRATQILQEKMDTIRLYTWDQVNSNGFIPPTFSAPFYPLDTQSSGGLIYQGTLTLTNAPVSEAYAGDLRLVVAELNWTSGNVARQRQMKTLVSKYGLYNYVY